jgi:hypothetical protein
MTEEGPVTQVTASDPAFKPLFLALSGEAREVKKVPSPLEKFDAPRDKKLLTKLAQSADAVTPFTGVLLTPRFDIKLEGGMIVEHSKAVMKPEEIEEAIQSLGYSSVSVGEFLTFLASEKKPRIDVLYACLTAIKDYQPKEKRGTTRESGEPNEWILLAKPDANGRYNLIPIRKDMLPTFEQMEGQKIRYVGKTNVS